MAAAGEEHQRGEDQSEDDEAHVVALPAATVTESLRFAGADTETRVVWLACVLATVGVLIAGLVTKAGDGHDDRLNAHDTWLIVAILTVGYLISRGLAKSGTRDPYWADGTNEQRDAR